MRVKLATIAAACAMMMPFPPAVDDTINATFNGDVYTTIDGCDFDSDGNLVQCEPGFRFNPAADINTSNADYVSTFGPITIRTAV